MLSFPGSSSILHSSKIVCLIYFFFRMWLFLFLLNTIKWNNTSSIPDINYAISFTVKIIRVINVIWIIKHYFNSMATHHPMTLIWNGIFVTCISTPFRTMCFGSTIFVWYLVLFASYLSSYYKLFKITNSPKKIFFNSTINVCIFESIFFLFLIEKDFLRKRNAIETHSCQMLDVEFSEYCII